MTERITGLKNAAPYLRMYKGKTFVVKAGGEVIGEERNLDNLSEQIAIFHELGINIIFVHGGGPQATDLSEKLGLPVELISGRRVTNAETLEVAKMVFNGKLNTDILSALRKHKVPAVGLSGVDGGLIVAKQRPKVKIKDEKTGEMRDVDFGFVGDISSVNTLVLEHLLNGQFVPVVSAMAGGDDGAVYNVNADVVAGRISSAVRAEKLIFLTDVAGVLRDKKDPASIISHMTRGHLEEILITSATDGMKVKLESCKDAIDQGVPRVHIISGLMQDSLLMEVFTNEGVGTLIEC